MHDAQLFARMPVTMVDEPQVEAARPEVRPEPPRLRRPDRAQVRLEPVSLEARLAADHAVRTVWAVVERLDLEQFLEVIAARGSDPGRAATDPRLLVALWLWATIDNVGSARRLARLCEEHDAYRWLCGGVSLNHHLLSDFRVGHGAALDDLLTQVIAALVDRGAVKVARISQDSLRTRAGAGRSSYRRQERLKLLLAEAKSHVERLKAEGEREDDARAPRQQAAQERAARERVARVEAALEVMPELEAIKTHPTGKPSRDEPARVSTTDPQARRMKLGSGAIAPAYNVQFAADTASRVIVGVEVVNSGTDHNQSEPLRKQVEQRSGLKVKEHLMDGGYVKKESIEAASASGVAVYAPLPKGNDGEPCTQGRRDGPGVKAWRERMQSEEGKTIYKQRASTSETVNAEVKTVRGLASFNVRGLKKVRCVALWSALAYNLVHASVNLLA